MSPMNSGASGGNGGESGLSTPPLTKPNDVELFRVNDLLIGLDDKVFHEFAARCEFRAFNVGETLVEGGSEKNEVFFVIRGAVRIVQDSGGVNVVYSKVTEGGWFGEIAAIDKGERSANVFALSDGLAAVAARPLFLNLMLEHRQIAVKVLESLATVVRSSNEKVAEVSSFSGVQRVYLKLLELADGTPTQAGTWIVREIPPHDQLSAMASTSKETVARALNQLLQGDVAKHDSGQLEILDIGRLKQLATEV